SIGTQALEVVQRYPDRFEIAGLSANNNVKLLADQAKHYRVKSVCLSDPANLEELLALLKTEDIEVLAGEEGLLELSGRDNVDMVLNGLVGAAGMLPTIQALKSGRDVALSNKESLVMAGSLIMELVKKHQVNLYPVDSEHSAIWQSLQGENPADVKKLLLTASGGPFRTREKSDFKTITLDDALKHPNWNMGAKITIDSATMMNKDLEVIEARWLFSVAAQDIEILVHPQSIIHSLVEFRDGSVKAQLGVPDMKVPIQYALTYPEHLHADWPTLDLLEIGNLTFEKPDMEKFPCIQLAYDALRTGGSAPAVLNVANDKAVAAYLQKKIHFTDIPGIIDSALEKHEFIPEPNFEQILALSDWTARFVKNKTN
ncbi:MAG: 1-deoxy-D-xylulose-5-phosphate reductoisomerase, partial [FCB group bacterium]|nr:1-deoxy-D-xylulose-5-phosphate reductoisomerase [FCB group bacterium]